MPVQTQLIGLNNSGVTVGFFSDQNNANQVNDNFGFFARDGRFKTRRTTPQPLEALLHYLLG